MKLFLRLVVLSGVLAVGFFLYGGRAHAATLTVGGACTLEDAIVSVNNAADAGSCSATGSYGTNDTITMPAGTITLAGNPALITRDVVFTGAGMGQTIIDGVDAYFGLSCAAPVPPSTISVSVSDVTFTRMSEGAIASAVACNLSVANVEVTQSTPSVTGLIVLGDDFSGAYTNLTVNNSLSNVYIHNNFTTPSNGVLIFILSTGPSTNTNNVNIDRVTIAQNPDSLGIASTSYGYDNNTANVTITNTTIDGSNQPGLGIVAGTVGLYGGTATTNVSVKNSTIVNFVNPTNAQPAAGIYIGAGADIANIATVNLDMQNTLLANNLIAGSPLNCSAQNFGDGGTETTTLNSLGHNLTDDASCGTAQPSDIYSQTTASIINTLGPLQNNGGMVPTRALLAGSPAIDAGTTISGITTDARGVSRPQGSAYDIGAYELQQTTPTPTPTTNAQANLADTGENTKLYLAGIIALMLAGAGLLFVVLRKSK